jgi:S-DNA-T family DNA segregation ATPase FtsK/SpoIIIE
VILAAGAVLLLLRLFVPWWAWLPPLAAVTVALLARHGHPPDKPILRPAVVTPRFRVLNADIVLRAYYAAGLGHPDKPDLQVTFGSPMRRDGEGSGVDVDLPYGKTLKDAINAKDNVASGLDVQVSQVFMHRDPTSTRRHHLWVADRDPLAVPVGRTPLLACRQTDIWKPAPFGLDERGQLVTVPLMWSSVLVSALPRAGKTFSARLLALFCALDPYVKLDVFDFKGSPDWRKFALVADSCAFGLTPTKDGLPGDIFRDTLERIKADVQDRYTRLSELAGKHPELAPEGKLTKKLARDPQFGMPVRVLFMDEFQEIWDASEQVAKDIAGLLVSLVKVGPGAGVILVDSTQRPSGVGGSGQLAQQFISFRDNHAVRFGLRTSSWQVSELCLGAGAYSEGLDTSTLLPQYRGVGILRGAGDASPTVRTYLADGQDAEKILTAARALREHAGTLSGYAAGVTVDKPVRDVLADVLAVMGDRPGLHWQPLAEKLAARFPDRYADATGDSLSADLRALGVPSVPVKVMGQTLRGCRREDVSRAASG